MLVGFEGLRERFPDISEVPHGRQSSVYEQILQGVPYEHQLQEPQRLQREDDELQGDKRARVEVPEEAVHTGAGAGNPDTDSDVIFAELDEDFWQDVPDDIFTRDLQEGIRSPAEVSEGAATELEEAAAAAVVVPPPLEVEQPARMPGAAASDEPRDIAGPVEVEQVLERPGKWGCFRISAKQSKRGLKYGAFEGFCPFHARSKVTACKKLVTISGPTQQDKVEALLRCKYWCAQARSVERQWQHLAIIPPFAVPPADVIEGMRIDDPPLRVQTDDEYYQGLHQGLASKHVSFSDWQIVESKQL